MTLGAIDLDVYVEKHVIHTDEYILNFKTLKNKRKLIDKIPDIEKYDCCIISLSLFKLHLDDLFQRIHDTLLIALRRNLLLEFREVGVVYIVCIYIIRMHISH